jgi:diacylglycerol O-acyltransferase / wax synthase
MRQQLNHEHLSWSDSAFLYLEREGVPLHIGGVHLLEGIVSLEDCIRFFEWKVQFVPRYRQRVVTPLFNIGLPTWEFDPDFDVRDHIREVTLKHGTVAEFKAVTGKVLGELMDRRHPLWDITLVRGFKGDRTGLITRVHHCLGDGVAGVGLMNVIMDASPMAPDLSNRRRRFRVPRPRDPWAAMMDGWTSSYANAIEQVQKAQSEVLNIAETIAANGGVLLKGKPAQLLAELAAPTEPLHFNVTCRGPQKVAWVEIPLAEMKAVKDAWSCSFNDVALALVTATIRRYASLHGDRVKGRLLRIMVPVNIRGNGSTGDLGNRVSLIPFTIPLDIRSCRKLAAAVHERMDFLKNAHVAELISLANGLMGILPPGLQGLAGPMGSRLQINPFNLVCTNVPGPQFPLYMMGHKILDWHPYVPISGDMAVNCAILSYNGVVYFGFSADAHAAPDVARLEKFVILSMEELREAAGITPRRKEQVQPKTHAAAVPAVERIETTRISTPVPTVLPAAEAIVEPKRAVEAKEVVTMRVRAKAAGSSG